MSEENTVTGNEGISDSTATPDVTTDSVDTQQASTGEQADTTTELKTNGSEIGLQKKEETESSESGAYSSESIDSLVKSALNGELTDEQREKIDSDGLGSHFDMIVKGHQAEIAKNDAEIIGVVGTKEAYGELQEWALSNLSDSEVEAFNKAVISSGDIGIAKLAVEGLQARYLRMNGQIPSKRIEAGGTANEADRPYTDKEDYIRETMSMKYRRDPEYQALVEAKRNKSGF